MTSIVLQIATASKPDKFLQVRHKPLKYLAADSSQGQRQQLGRCPLVRWRLPGSGDKARSLELSAAL